MKKKRIKISLSDLDEEILKTLSLRFNITKSQVISQALKCFAANKKTYIKIGLFSEKEEKRQEPDNKEEKDLQELCRVAKTRWIL